MNYDSHLWNCPGAVQVSGDPPHQHTFKTVLFNDLNCCVSCLKYEARLLLNLHAIFMFCRKEHYETQCSHDVTQLYLSRFQVIPLICKMTTHDEYQYLSLVRRVLDTGEVRADRTGTGTISIFAPPSLKFSLADSPLP